jgi:hypothetical protein
MASTYSDSLKLELMETGANAATWGTNTNTNLEVLDAFTQGYVSKSVAGSANITLSTGNADPNAEAANKVIELTGTLTGNIVVFIPAVTGGSEYLFFNNTSGSQTLTIAATGHTANGAVITQGAYSRVYCDGTANFNVKIQTSVLGAVTTKGAAVFDAGATVTAGQDLTAGSGNIIARSNGQVQATLFTGSGAGLTGITTSGLADGAVTLAKMASGTDGNLISYDASGNPVAVATGNDGQVLTSTGAGSPPAFESLSVTNTPAFSARMSGAQSVSNETFTKVDFDTENFDTDGAYDPSTNQRFTVPSGKAGIYFFNTFLIVDAAGAAQLQNCQLAFYKNGSLFKKQDWSFNSNDILYAGLTLSSLMNLAVSDYIEVFVRISDASGNPVVDGSASTLSEFSGFKLIST